jgi:hypothetical protein
MNNETYCSLVIWNSNVLDTECTRIMYVGIRQQNTRARWASLKLLRYQRNKIWAETVKCGKSGFLEKTYLIVTKWVVALIQLENCCLFREKTGIPFINKYSDIVIPKLV